MGRAVDLARWRPGAGFEATRSRAASVDVASDSTDTQRKFTCFVTERSFLLSKVFLPRLCSLCRVKPNDDDVGSERSALVCRPAPQAILRGVSAFTMRPCCCIIQFLAIAAFFFAEEARGCGILTHTEIGHRALYFFNDRPAEDVGRNFTYKNLMQAHQDAFQAGNPYPDAMYDSLCFKGKFHQLAEDTHWTPFMVTTIDYIREKYPPPWDVATQKLVVFLLGFVSHQIADVLWHNLGIQDGFLQAMANANFHHNFGQAHDAGDLGGDVVGAFEWNTSFVEDIHWYVPTEDLQQIYHRYYIQHQGADNYNITSSEISECASLIYLGRFGEVAALKKLFPSHAEGSPFLVEELSEYYLGGLDSNAEASTLLWHDAITMLENGTNSCQHGESPISVVCSAFPPRRWTGLLGDKRTKPLFTKLSLFGLDKSDVIIEHVHRGIRLKPSQKLKDLVANANQEMHERKKEAHSMELKVSVNAKGSKLKADVTYVSKVPYSRLGWSLSSADMNGDKSADLLIGSPGYSFPDRPQAGAVFLVLSKDGRPLGSGVEDVELVASAKLEGQEAFGRFGSGLAVVDLNRDGLLDVAVGSPSFGQTYSGAVGVFFNFPNGLSTQPNVTLSGEKMHENFGWVLAGGDLDGDGFADLVVGSPFVPGALNEAGSVMVFTSSAFHAGQGLKPTWVAEGSIRSAWFGHSLRVPPKSGLLLVGSPDADICRDSLACAVIESNNTQSVGNLTIYTNTASNSSVLDLTIVHSMRGKMNFEKLGTSADVGLLMENTRVLAVSSATADVQGHVLGVKKTLHQAGRVLLYNMSSSSGYDEPFAVLEGDRSFGRFGWKVELSDINGDGFSDLLVSAPLRIVDLTEEITGGEHGQAYVFLGGKHFPTSKNVTDDCGLSVIRPCPGHVASFTLGVSEDKSRFGSWFTVVGESPSQTERMSSIAVSAVRSEAGSRASGAVHIFNP